MWHQPLFSFYRIYSLDDTSLPLFFVLILVTLALAYLSWRYFEQPFRDKNKVSRKVILYFSLIGTLIISSIGVIGVYYNGFSFRYEAEENILSFRKYDRTEAYRLGACFLRARQSHIDFVDECFYQGNENEIVLWGDSHAGALSYGMRKRIRGLTQVAASSCPPLMGYVPKERPFCTGVHNLAFEYIEKRKPESVVLHANWNVYRRYMNNLKKTIQEIRKRSPSSRVYIIGTVPQWKPNLPTLIAEKKFLCSKLSA